MLSRVAENLYWISRYAERAENLARLLDSTFQLELDAAALVDESGEQGPVASVLSILGCRDYFEARHGATALADRELLLNFLTFDRTHGDSILSMLARARENARGTQQSLSADVWGQVNRLYLYLTGPRARRRFQASPARFYEGIKRSCVLLDGLIDVTLPRGEVYHFLQLGRYLERVNQICRILIMQHQFLQEDTLLGDAPLRVVLGSSVLRSCSAYDAYIRQYQDRIDLEGIVAYLVLDPDFPRSVRFGVARCCESLSAIAGTGDHDFASEAERVLGRLDSDLRFVELEELFRAGLTGYLNRVLDSCHKVGDEIHQSYFYI